MFLLSIVFVSHNRHHLVHELIQSIPTDLLQASFLQFSILDNSSTFPCDLLHLCTEKGIAVHCSPGCSGPNNFLQYLKLPQSRFIIFFHDDDVVQWHSNLSQPQSLLSLSDYLSSLPTSHYYYPTSFIISTDLRSTLSSPASVSPSVHDPRGLPPYPGLLFPLTSSFTNAFKQSLDRPLGKYSDVFLQLSLIRQGITPKLIKKPFYQLLILQHPEQDSATLDFLDFAKMWVFSLNLRSNLHYFPVFLVHCLSGLKTLISQRLRRNLRSR